MESSIKDFEEHQRWKVMMWLFGYSLGFSSNLGILDGSLTGIGGQKWAWSMGSFIKWDKSIKSNVARK
jgi:hypothetical protein